MKKGTQLKNTLPLLPVLLAISVTPLVVRIYGYHAHLAGYEWFSAGDSCTDCFLYYKALLFIILTGVMLLLIAYQFVFQRKKLKNAFCFFPLAGYLFFTLLSAFFSVSPYHSVHGAYEQFESAFVLTGYLAAAWFTFLFVDSEEKVSLVLRWWTAGAVILCVLGIGQFLKLDLYKTDFLKFFTVGPGGSFQVTIAPGIVYMSLYNPNYVGLYSSMALPVFLVLSLCSTKKRSRIGYALLFFGFLICLYGSGSKNGILTFFLLLLFLTFLFRKILLKKRKYMLAGAGILFVLAAGFFFFDGRDLAAQIKSAFYLERQPDPPLQNIRTTPEHVEIDYNGNTLYAGFRTDAESPDQMLMLTDKKGDDIKTIKNTSDYTLLIDDARFPDFYAAPLVINNVIDHNEVINHELDSFVIGMDQSEWIFTNQQGDGEYYYVTKAGKLDKIQDRNFHILKGYESIFSGRGFIWSRTLPLLKKYILKGSGPDTFTIVYPNDDYVGRHNHGFSNTLVTRPHSLYLQIAVQTGGISLLLFLAFYLIYFIESILLYWKCDLSDWLSRTGAAILAGTAGYMVSGLTNDSTIAVTPVFWILAGLGLSVNHMVRRLTI